MKIYLLEQDVCGGYDTYDSCVVIAATEEKAKMIHPATWDCIQHLSGKKGPGEDWAVVPAEVEATYLGEADEGFNDEAVLCASFNAG